ncbi:putative integral membrane protein [Tritonibacter multivorans]|uniref:Putative integral membrane protein n=2 Tax=Tritonibacter multivorans TaxID=928856 RepID=A0A0P1GTY7_9RHOB|nr:putative integral membrane protein [Tritonibacter multivorans]SFD28363.1 Uncharacterized membrane protein [Tritonibacter multivorans]
MTDITSDIGTAGGGTNGTPHPDAEGRDRTIGNPVSWAMQSLGRAGSHAAETVEEIRSDSAAHPEVRKITMEDLRAALTAGWSDFTAARSDAMFLVFIYPLIGVAMVSLGFRLEMIPLLFPMIMGFALIGPVAAIGLYEMSRRREAGEEMRWMAAFSVLRSPAFGPILLLGLYLGGLFVGWMLAAQFIYVLTLGPEMPESALALFTAALTTPMGWVMTIAGTLVGAGFALAALAVSIVSFPLLLDRPVGLPIAVSTSMEMLRKNRRLSLTWGAMVGSLLVVGSIPMFLGLVIVVPLLGHATWHLYRRAVV